MHGNADTDAACRTRNNMLRWTIGNQIVLLNHDFRPIVHWQLHTASHSGTHCGGIESPIEAADSALTPNMAECVEGAVVNMLCPHGKDGRIGLQSRLDEEKGGSQTGAHDARRRS